MAEDGLQSTHSSKDSDSIGTFSILTKVVEVVLSIFAIGLIVDPFNSFNRTHLDRRAPKLDDVVFIYITLGSYLIINTVFIISHAVLGDQIPKRLSVIFSTVGALFHIIAASLMVHNWRKLQGSGGIQYNNEVYGSKQYLDMLISGAVFTFLTFATFVVDIVLTFRY
ncbi:uncharacterized protein LOC117172156 [Belonocnema kinseyi]|uniref:uncharacterized protein LOC117172156 n=1 Tax=Belonocnema kinseyi TaxID=2817044 RepID=UPI00143D5935|nr:uncharacterized protein LOC117172156 [Belonocnema kinseyi]